MIKPAIGRFMSYMHGFVFVILAYGIVAPNLTTSWYVFSGFCPSRFRATKMMLPQNKGMRLTRWDLRLPTLLNESPVRMFWKNLYWWTFSIRIRILKSLNSHFIACSNIVGEQIGLCADMAQISWDHAHCRRAKATHCVNIIAPLTRVLRYLNHTFLPMLYIYVTGHSVM
jgi:hypothetical protein